MNPLFLMSEEIATKDMSILGLFHHADIVVKCIILGLLAASVICWAMAFEKLIRVWMVNREISKLEKSGQTASIPQAHGSSLIGAVGEAARTEWSEAGNDASTGEVRDRLEVAMRAAVKRKLKNIEQGLPFLATIGSAAPFIGLFGTVWGIMNSFTAIAQQKDTSLAVVAPGIAEALFATAIGLAAAIPAVIFYNQITVALGRASERVMPVIVSIARKMSRRGLEGLN